MPNDRLDTSRLDALFAAHLDTTFPAAQIEIRRGGASLYRRDFGFLDPDTRSRPTTAATRFDLASVSKLFTVTALMTLVEENRIALDQPVATVLAGLHGLRPIAPYPDPLHPGVFIDVVPPSTGWVDAGAITFRHLLAHNSGLPAWLALWKIPRREERRAAALGTSFSYPTGTHVVYSDIGLILLGFAMEAVTGQPLDQIIHTRVAAPLGLSSIGYGPLAPQDAAPTEWYPHQGRRMCGEVHDENAWSLGGVAGHAGLFGTVGDVARLGEMYRACGAPLLNPETVAEMTRVHAEEGAVRRGIGFLLRSPDPTANSHPFDARAFGHFGFTGTALWIDPRRDLVVACVTNRVYYGRQNAEAIAAFRLALHRTLCEMIP